MTYEIEDDDEEFVIATVEQIEKVFDLWDARYNMAAGQGYDASCAETFLKLLEEVASKES